MEFEELLKELSARMGGEIELTPNEEGIVALDVDGMELSVLHFAPVHRLVLSGVIGVPPPEEKIERLYHVMLQSNYQFRGTFGCTLSINPNSDEVSLCKQIPLAILDGESFFAEVERFVNIMSTWRTLLNDFRGDEAEIADRYANVVRDLAAFLRP